MNKGKKKFNKLILQAILIIHSFIVIYPIFIMLITAFKNNLEVMKNPFGLPEQFKLDAFQKMWNSSNFLTYYKNSIVVTLASIAVIITVSVLASYMLGRHTFKGRNLIYFFFFAGMMIPIRLGVINLFKIFLQLKLFDNLLALILVYTAMGIPFSIFIITTFFSKIPDAIEEAAIIDGSTRFKTLLHIFVPLIRPAIATAAIYHFVPIWNDFYFPLVLIRNDDLKTLPLGTAMFYGQFQTDWGCLWETTEDGIVGTVTRHPLSDWKAFPDYKMPDPDTCMGIGPVDWNEAAASILMEKEKGNITQGGLRHSHTFLQLCDIRGYENLTFDMCDSEPNLKKLIMMVEEFNLNIINRYLDLGTDLLVYPEDLGMQNGPMISPKHFREYIKPSYQRLMSPARQKGVIVHMHSDGNIHELIDDIIDGRVEIINFQDLVNGIDWIADRFAGKVCVELDIDRQLITSHGTPRDIDELIRKEVSTISTKEGGLMTIYGLYPGIPLENISALMDTMERYAFY